MLNSALDNVTSNVNEINVALSPNKRTIRAIGIGYGGAIYVCYHLPAKRNKAPTVTNMAGGVTGFAETDSCKVVLDTSRTDGQTLCFKITHTNGGIVEANRPYLCMVSFTIS